MIRTRFKYITKGVVLLGPGVGANTHGYNQMYFKRRSQDAVLIMFMYGSKKEEIERILQDAEINCTDDNKRFGFQLDERQIGEKLAIFPRIAALNKRWWQE